MKIKTIKLYTLYLQNLKGSSLAGNATLPLELHLVLHETLISATLHLRAHVVLWQSVLVTKLGHAKLAVSNYEDWLVLAVTETTLLRGSSGGCSSLFGIASSQSEDEVKGGLLLNVIVREGSAVLELFSGENESLLVGWDTLLVLDLGLHVVDGVRALDFQGYSLSGEGLDEDLHASSETQD